MAFIYFGFVGIMFSSCCSGSYKTILIFISDYDDWLRSVFVFEPQRLTFWLMLPYCAVVSSGSGSGN
jgi:hypothetical protein